MISGLILFAHGARDPRWAEPLVRLHERVAQCAPEIAVETAFLEIMTPDLATAAARLVEKGCQSITIVPVFLGQGGHVRHDLAALMQTLRATHPAIELRSAPAVGEDTGVIDALASYCLRMLETETDSGADSGATP